jgi:hypothetical protein
MQKFEGADAMDLVRPGEEFDLTGVCRQLELPGIQVPYLGKLVRYRFIRRHTVKMTAFDHEWAGRD